MVAMRLILITVIAAILLAMASPAAQAQTRTCYRPYVARRVCETRCGWQGGVYRCTRVCYTICAMPWP
jgi:hypothetical protein